MGVCGSKQQISNAYMTDDAAAAEGGVALGGDDLDSKVEQHPGDTPDQAKLRAIFEQQLDTAMRGKVKTEKLEELMSNNQSMYDQLTQMSDFRIR